MKRAHLVRLVREVRVLCLPAGFAKISKVHDIKGTASSFSSCCTLMANSERDRVPKLDARRLSSSPDRSNDSQIGQDCDDPDYCLASSENLRRRSSTAEDEQRLKNLLQEILDYRGTNISSWIVESKVKNLCAAYKFLLKTHRDGFLKALACDHAVDHPMVCKAAKSLFSIEQQKNEDEGNKRQIMKAEEQLKNLLTPQYSWLFIHVGRLERGVKFLVDLRTDVLAVISEMEVKDPALVPMQQLNATLREMLSLWFSVGFLNLERVTWKSPCEMLQKISEYEAVHPVRNWTDLKRRVGLYRRCFVYTHSSMPDEPLVVLHTVLSDEIAGCMKGIVSATSRMSVDASACPGVLVDAYTEDPSCVKAAIFYSITSTQKGLQGIDLGNYLIKRVVQELQTEFPFVSQFSSLSPIPVFRLWLMERLKTAEKGQRELLTAEEAEQLRCHLQTNTLWSELKGLFKTNSWASDSRLVALLEAPLMRLCAGYLYLEKRRGYALDNVANFHLRNGAVMWRLNWQADLSVRGLANSCGIMVNYRYFLEDTETNSRAYVEKQHIVTSDEVRQLALAARDVIEILPSKM